MISVKARITVINRTNPIYSHYRPDFVFIPGVYTMGVIELIDMFSSPLNEPFDAYITFWYPQRLGENFGPGSTFKFHEGTTPTGYGEVLEILPEPLVSKRVHSTVSPTAILVLERRKKEIVAELAEIEEKIVELRNKLEEERKGTGR